MKMRRKLFLFLVSNLSFSALLPATHKMLNFGSNSKKTFSDKKIRRFGQNFHVSDKYFDIFSFRTKFSTFWTNFGISDNNIDDSDKYFRHFGQFLVFRTKISTIRTNILDISNKFWHFGRSSEVVFRYYSNIKFWPSHKFVIKLLVLS